MGHPTDVNELVTILRELEVAMRTGPDAAEVFARHTRPDYVFTSPTGVVSSRAEVIDGLRNGSVRFTKYSMTDLDVRDYGAFAVVIGRAEGDGVNPGGEMFHGAYRFTSVWDRVEGPWRLVAWQATAVREATTDEGTP